MSIIFEQFSESDQNDGEFTPFMVAVKENLLEDVKGLYDEFDFESKSALTYAREKGYGEIVKFLEAQILEEKRRDEFRTLSYSEFPLIRDSFITKEKDDDTGMEHEILQIKGFALLMEYFANKDKNSFYNCYVADSEQALMHAFKTLIKARNSVRFSVIYRLFPHYVPILCEKIEDNYHITVQDSIEKNAKISELVSQGFKGKLKRVILNQNNESRQKTKFDCGFFTIKDARKTLKLKPSEFFSFKLEKEGHILKDTTEKSGLRVREYRNPPEFMRLAQSMKSLETYIKNYPEEASRILRKNKMGEPQTLKQYALQKRNKYGVETPFQIPSDDPDKPKIQNRTISYFGNKYLGVIEEMIRNCTQGKLREIIDTYDATKLRVCSDSAVRSEIQERIFIKQKKENVQIADQKNTKEHVALVITESQQAVVKNFLTSSRKRKRLDS